MKSFILVLVFVFSCFLSTFTGEGASEFSPKVHTTPEFSTPVCVTVNDNYVLTDTPAFLLNGITYVPMRLIADSLECDSILWNEKTSTAIVKKDDIEITLKKGSNNAAVNGKTVKLDAKSNIYADRFYVPVRFVAETFNTRVLWDKDTYTVNIFANGVNVPDSVIKKRNYTDDDIYWLSRIINAESAGEPMRGKVAVANVVLNRVNSSLYADNIYDVIFDKNYGVQFSPVLNGTIYNTPTADSIIAAKRAFLGEKNVGNSLYFLNPRISTSFWIVNNRTFYKSIGNHDFYL